MAEKVKRRVAAARMAVAFVAAGTIAGAASWAQASPPPPTAQSSAVDAFLKIDNIKGENIVDGSLLFKDFAKQQVPSYKVFQKVELSQKHFQKVEIQRKYYPKVEIDRLFVKGESSDYIKHQDLNGYIKQADADARYIKLTDAVIRGHGSALTATKVVDTSVPVPIITVDPSLISVNAITSGQEIEVTNTSGGPLLRTSCAVGTPGGVVAPGGKFTCPLTDVSQSLQVITQSASPTVATLSFSAVSLGAGAGKQVTVQMLIGLL